MELYKLKSAMLVTLDIGFNNIFDIKTLLGVDEADSFYHVVPVKLGYRFPVLDYTGTKTHVASLSVNEPMPAEQCSQHKFWIAGYEKKKQKLELTSMGSRWSRRWQVEPEVAVAAVAGG